MEFLERLYAVLPPVPAGRSAGVACAIGFLFGGLGLWAYTRSVVDLVLPVVFLLMLTLQFQQVGSLMAVLIAALHGFFRVHLSPAPEGSCQITSG